MGLTFTVQQFGPDFDGEWHYTARGPGNETAHFVVLASELTQESYDWVSVQPLIEQRIRAALCEAGATDFASAEAAVEGQEFTIMLPPTDSMMREGGTPSRKPGKGSKP